MIDKETAIAIYVYGLAILIPCVIIGVFVPSMAFIPLLMVSAGMLASLVAVALIRHYEK